jgi:hypothetical protein
MEGLRSTKEYQVDHDDVCDSFTTCVKDIQMTDEEEDRVFMQNFQLLTGKDWINPPEAYDGWRSMNGSAISKSEYERWVLDKTRFLRV